MLVGAMPAPDLFGLVVEEEPEHIHQRLAWRTFTGIQIPGVRQAQAVGDQLSVPASRLAFR
jgi:hypothetical protein